MAIIGAGGMLGRMVVHAAERAGVDVVAVVRNHHSLASVPPSVAEAVVTRGCEEALLEALRAADAVVDVSVGTALEIASAAATLRRAVSSADVKRLVYTSSAAAQALPRRLGRPRPRSFYGRQKAIAEQTLASLNCDGVAVAIVRPGLVWGPRSGWSVRHVDALLRSRPVVVGGRSASRPHLAYGPNLAAALLEIAYATTPVSGMFDYADTWWDSWVDYARALARAIGVPPSAVVAPDRVRLGGAPALAAEFVVQHPRLRAAVERQLQRSPAVVQVVARTAVKPVAAPAHLRLFAPDGSPGRTVAVMNRADADVFTKWEAPSHELRFLVKLSDEASRDEALRATAEWASAAGFAPVADSAGAAA